MSAPDTRRMAAKTGRKMTPTHQASALAAASSGGGAASASSKISEPAASLPCNTRMAGTVALPRLVTRETPHRGKGVFTLDAISEDALVELAHVVVLSAADYKLCEQTNLYNYLYEWPEDASGGALATGFGSHFNHSSTENCLYHKFNFAEGTISYWAERDIAPGEELLIDYGFVWFEENDGDA
jgi:hypothetical protein